MIYCTDINAMRAQVVRWKKAGQTLAIVPTMGNLHAGHMALVQRAKERVDRVVVSIFVNPLQFNESADFDAYPRTLEQDSNTLAAANLDALFTPSSADIYPLGQSQATKIVVPGLSDVLEGECRPGHFTGVATVVNKLFNIVQADLACFGEKDYQQLMLIRRMVNELDMPIIIEAVATVREPGGLAMSSRNKPLNEQQRNTAKVLYQQLSAVKQALEQGRKDYLQLESEAAKYIQQQGMWVEYVAIRRSYDLELPAEGDTELVVLVAARLGEVRLIDNISLDLELQNSMG
jgi:pantoate--beta-alanine ligase